MERRVADDGSLTAEIMVVVGAPGKTDVQRGFVLSGVDGYILSQWFRQAGLRRDDLYVTALVDDIPRAPRGDIDMALRNKTLHRTILEEGMARVHELAAQMPNLKVIVPLGNYPAYAVSPGGQVAWDKKGPDITKVRGSVYTMKTEDGRKVKVVPSLHPSMLMGSPNLEPRCVRDWKRISEERHNGIFGAPKRQHNIEPTKRDVQDFLGSLNDDTVVSLDIETWGNVLHCIGYSISQWDSIVIPTKPELWGGEWPEVWQLIQDINAHPCDKVMQNGLFDSWWLERLGAPVRGFYWDTLAMHHCLYPLDSHSLDFLASIYSRQPYWKDEAKEADEIVRIAKNCGMQKLYVYNGLDVTVTHEIFQALLAELEAEGMIEFYLRHYAQMFKPLLNLMKGGVRVDVDRIKEDYDKYNRESVEWRDKAADLAGRPLWVFKGTKCERDMLEAYWQGKRELSEMVTHLLDLGHKPETIAAKWGAMQAKGVSDELLNEVLYDHFECPKGKRTPTDKIKADNISLKTLRNTVQERKRGKCAESKELVLGLIDATLEQRRAKKLASFCNLEKIDSDGRLRCTYKFNTKSGRLASSKNPLGTGRNLQNTDRKLKSHFIASPGNWMLECDLSQAESRVVRCLSGDEEQIRLARRLPTEGDEHKENAAIIFSNLWGRPVPLEEITKEQRQLGKVVSHASNYMMQGETLSNNLLKNGDTYTPKECQALLDAYRAGKPAITAWQEATKRVIIENKKLITSWGRRVRFDNLKLDDDMLRFGISYIPQSEVGDLTNHYGLKPLDKLIEKEGLRSRIVLQIHDAVYVDAHPDELYDIMVFLHEHLTRPRMYGQVFGREVELSMPVEFKIGRNAASGVEFKLLPTQAELEGALS